MIQKIVNKLKHFALIPPVYAQIVLEPDQKQWSPLTELTPASIISGAISLVMLVVAVVFFFILIFGGLRWVTSQGDEKNVAAAKAQITNALIGLAIVFAAWAIMRLINIVFGINIFELTIPRF